MANISSASGTITLQGDWPQEAIKNVQKLFEVWNFYGEYGIQSIGKITSEDLTVDFTGCGKWSFSNTLEKFDYWTRDYIGKNPTASMSLAEYEAFLEQMNALELTMEFDFRDCLEGGAELNVLGEFSVVSDTNGFELIFEEESCSDTDWSDYPGAFEKAVMAFSRFAGDKAAKDEIIAFVKTYVIPSGIYRDSWNGYEIDVEGMCNQQYLDQYYWLPPKKDCFQLFYEYFQPETQVWSDFVKEVNEFMDGWEPDEKM